MKTNSQKYREAIELLNSIRDDLKEKLDLIDAEETHGEDLDEDTIAASHESLEEALEKLDEIDGTL